MSQRSLTPEQLDAVKAYAHDHGTGWKESLTVDWMRGGSTWTGPYHLLQQVRNQHGPRWLADFRLSPETDGQILGWAYPLGKYGDSRSREHLFIDKDGIGVCVCGSKGGMPGQVEKDPPTNACKRCKRCAKKNQPAQTDTHGCDAPERVTCGSCGNSWCERCDPAPSALCHYCHGRGVSTAPLGKA